MHCRIARPAAVLVLALAALADPPPAAGQTTVLDEGTFRLLIHGQEIGSETFSIRQSGTGDGANIISSGRIVLDRAGGAQQITAQLEVRGLTLRPAAYQVVVEGPEPRRIAGQLTGGRFRAKIISPVGEQMREYLASDGAFLIDEGVAHHYYFLARLAGGGTPGIPILIPQQNRQVMASVTAAGRETVEVDGRALQARRLVVAPANGPERHVWVDERNRVLRLEIPESGYIAVRTAPPG